MPKSPSEPSHMTLEKAQPEQIARDFQQPPQSHLAWLQAAFERFERPLIAYAMRLLDGNIESARDCVQDTFLSLCRESQSHVEGHIDAWLFKTCRNRAMDHHRREARMTIDTDSSALATASAPPNDPVTQLMQMDEKQQLQYQINRLPKREQEVLALRLGQGLSYKQIADITDLSVSNVGVLIHQAVTRLRSSMNAAT
jgi:RNA polymerase sigma-70 factor (ECF subfamily)